MRELKLEPDETPRPLWLEQRDQSKPRRAEVGRATHVRLSIHEPVHEQINLGAGSGSAVHGDLHESACWAGSVCVGTTCTPGNSGAPLSHLAARRRSAVGGLERP